MKRAIITILTASLLLMSCVKEEWIDNRFLTFTVPDGNHYCFPHPVIQVADMRLDFNVKTNESWIWDVPEKNGFSKVVGMQFVKDPDFSNPQDARLVYWNVMRDSSGVKVLRHEWWFYCYVNNLSPQDNPEQKVYICDAVIGETYRGTIWYSNDSGVKHYNIDLNGVVRSIKCNQGKSGVPFVKFPYIGGTYTIDHDWIVEIELLN